MEEEKGPQWCVAAAPRGEGLAYSHPMLPAPAPVPPDRPRKRSARLMASWTLLRLPPELSWLKLPSPPSSSLA